MKKTYWIFLSILVVIINSILTYKIMFDSENAFSLKKLEKIIHFKNSSATLIIYLSGNCIKCMEEAPYWKKLDENFVDTRLRIYGFVSSSHSKKMVKNSEKINFPVYIDKKEYLMRKLKIRFLPFKILVDRDGKIIYMEPTLLTEKSHSNFVYDITEIINRVELTERWKRTLNNLP